MLPGATPPNWEEPVPINEVGPLQRRWVAVLHRTAIARQERLPIVVAASALNLSQIDVHRTLLNNRLNGAREIRIIYQTTIGGFGWHRNTDD